MKKLPVLIACLVALTALVAGACGPVASYAATVNGTKISQEDLNQELEAIRANKKFAAAIEQNLAQGGEKLAGSGQNTFDASFTARILNQQIVYSLITQEVKKRKLEVTDAQVDEARESWKKRLNDGLKDPEAWDAFPKEYQDVLARRDAEAEALQKDMSKGATSEAAIAKFYEENKARFEETCSRHILAVFPGDRRNPATPPPTPQEEEAAKAKAQGWKDRLDKGEDFAAMAKAESGDPTAAQSGGDLGCRGGFVEEFTQAMAQLQPGQRSGPVRTQFGYHIIEVTSRKQRTLEEARDVITEQLEADASQTLQAWVGDELKKAEIKVNPKYGSFDKGGEGVEPQVVPPKGPATTTTAPTGQPFGVEPGAEEGGANP